MMSSKPLKVEHFLLSDIIDAAERQGIITTYQEIRRVMGRLESWPTTMSLTDAIMRELRKRHG